MNQSLWPAAFVVAALSLSLAPPASAQFGLGMWGSNRSSGLDIQQQRGAQMAQQRKYSTPAKSKAPPKPPALNLGTPDRYGRSDLSGRRPPGYATIRDPGAISGPARRSSAAPTWNRHPPRSSAPARASSPAPSIPRATRIPPPPPISPR